MLSSQQLPRKVVGGIFPLRSKKSSIVERREPILPRVTSFNYNMAKRTADPNDSTHRKRQKTTKILALATERHEILSPRDLQVLLAFDQDVGPVVRQSKNH